MKYSILITFCFYSLIALSQDEKLTVKDYGFQINESSIPQKAPNGYESVFSVKLNKALYANKAYEVGFWIIGRQLRDRGYSYPINVFPSNFVKFENEDIFNIVKSVDIMPALKVLPPPSYSGKGYFKFIIQPDTIYNYVTIVLKNNDWSRSPIDFKEDVTVTGVFIRPLNGMQKEEEAVMVNDTSVGISKEMIPDKIAERVLIDSEKSYSVTEQNISIGLYDHRNIDKDRVTIYLNDKIVVKNLELRRMKKIYSIKLEPGENIITLHAENLGEVAPNTAAILIKSESKEYEAILSSDLGQSQYFRLIYEPNN